MEVSHAAKTPRRNPRIDKSDLIQVDTLAKLFKCDFEDVMVAIEKSNGTFISVYEVITSKNKVLSLT